MQRISNEWQDYECIDAGNGEKLERWKNVILRRPDPQAMWYTLKDSKWDNIDGFYHRSKKGGGYWEYKNKFPQEWTITYKNLTFKVSPTNFKHTGIFPEQATNWDFMTEKISKCQKKVKVLNTNANWYGITYREDLDEVKNAINDMIERGEYPYNLWS